jgi:hypothetical protein
VCHARGRNPVYLDENGNQVRHVHLQVVRMAHSTLLLPDLDRFSVGTVGRGLYRIDPHPPLT